MDGEELRNENRHVDSAEPGETGSPGRRNLGPRFLEHELRGGFLAHGENSREPLERVETDRSEEEILDFVGTHFRFLS